MTKEVKIDGRTKAGKAAKKLVASVGKDTKGSKMAKVIHKGTPFDEKVEVPKTKAVPVKKAPRKTQPEPDFPKLKNISKIELYKMCKDSVNRLKAADINVEALNVMLGASQDGLDKLEATYKKYMASAESIEKSRLKEIEGLENDITTLKSQVSSFIVEVGDLNSDLDSAKRSIGGLKNENLNLIHELSSCNKLKESYYVSCASYELQVAELQNVGWWGRAFGLTWSKKTINKLFS